jgi:Rrf2 family protein
VIPLTVRYAFSAMTALARRQPDVVPVSELARELNVPANYLAKTLDRLRAAGLLEGVRGRAGGFRLRQAPEAVTMAEIAGVFEGLDPRGQCLMGRGACGDVGGCPLHSRWKVAMEPIHAFLRQHTLADTADASIAWEDPAMETNMGVVP